MKKFLRHLSLGIRREAKNHWERRVPLVPEDVERLVKELGVKVYVQPSSKRVIPDEKYQQAGAIIHEDLSIADVIVGVKEVPIQQLCHGKQYFFFSHTHKGQPYNMPMLKSIIDKKITLVDYELMTNEHGRRLVQFSKFAGYAGMIDGLHVMGHRLLALGFGSPFLAIGMSYMYRALADARLDVTRTGQVIADDGLPKELGPMTFVFTGDGQVSRGAQHVFKCLPHEWVSPNELAELASSTSFDHHKVYGCVVKASDYCVRKDGAPFAAESYFNSPHEYESVFSEKIAPYARMIINGIFWTEKYPRLLTNKQTEQLVNDRRLRLLTLADISCDINGSFEFMSEASTIGSPFYMYDPMSKKNHSDIAGPGIQIMSIDNLPTEMPFEASNYFSDALFPHIYNLFAGKKSSVIERATIVSQGALVPKYAHLSQTIQAKQTKKVLVLGSGYVAEPLVDYLDHHQVMIASNDVEEAKRLVKKPTVQVTALDVSDSLKLGSLVRDCDVVVSLLPANFHPIVAEKCLEHRKHLVTASYISPEMKSFDSQAKQLGLTFLNEIGLDPGIDHLTACEFFDKVRASNGQIHGFTSWCGGLPAPEHSNNPLGYKFSWSPKAVLKAAMNSATFKQNGKIVQIPGEKLLLSSVDVPILKGFAFEGLANRDSLKYCDLYGLKLDELETMFRGTLRYKGFSKLLDAFIQLGFTASTPAPSAWSLPTKDDIAHKLNLSVSDPWVTSVYESLKYFFSQAGSIQQSTMIDAFASLLEHSCQYQPDERDMILLHHQFDVTLGSRQQHTSTLICYGDPKGYSAMAKTVGLPAAIATDLLLNNQFKTRGVLAPTTSEFYKPILEQLRKHVVFSETF